MKRRRSFILLVVGAALLALAVGCGQTGDSLSDTTNQAEPKVGTGVGDLAPDFTVTTVDGEIASLGDFVESGTPVVVYFFASWCTTCRADMRTLKTVYPDYQDDVAFLAVDVDPSEDAELISRYREEQGYPWPMALYDPYIVGEYKITTQASKIVIDSDGVIVFRRGFGTLKEDQWRDALDLVLSGASS